MNEKRQELFEFYSKLYTDESDSEYKRHYRQLIQLMKEGRTVADGKKIVLTDDMLDYLYISHKLMRDFQSQKARKAGSVTSEAKARAARENAKKGGRPRKQQEEQ